MFAEPHAHSLSRAGKDELGTCLRSPQEIHLDRQQLEIVSVNMSWRCMSR